MKKIFIIEDDAVISTRIEKHLISWGFDTKIVKDFSNVINEFGEFQPHLCLLDIGLPYKNGYNICSELRKSTNIPIIFISSASENMSIIMAMNMGGDDYITKPFDMDVLTAKINALLRRSYDFNNEKTVITVKDLSLNMLNASATYKNEKTELTKNEYIILSSLMENPSIIMSRDELMVKLWDSDEFIDDNTLTVNVNRLRKKLSGIGCENFIETRKNLGYVINA